MADITIASGVVGDAYQGTETEPVLRVLVTDTFTAADGEIVLRSSFEEGEFYSEHTCFLVDDEIQYPSFIIHSTEDALANPDNTSYVFALFTADGEFIQVIAKRIRVPATPTTTSISALVIYNDGPAPTPPSGNDLYYTRAQVDALLAAITLIAATQAQAEAGTNNTAYMTPLRVAQALATFTPSIATASQAEAEAGTDNDKYMTPLRTAQAIAALVPGTTYATQALAEEGLNNNSIMTPLRTFQAIAVHIDNDPYGIGWSGDTTGTASRDALFTKIDDMDTQIAALGGALDLDDLSDVAITTPDTGALLRYNGTTWVDVPGTECIAVACSDQSTSITTGTAKMTFRMPYAFTLTAVRASVNTAPTGSTIIIDINEGDSPVSILSTRITIDASEFTSTTAATPPVISDTALADDAQITIDFDQVGSTIPGKGVVVYLIGYRAI